MGMLLLQPTFCCLSDTLVSSMLSSPGRAAQLEALPPLDEASQVLSATVLTCLAHYFSWAPLSATLTPQLLSTIFHFAAFGCEGKAGRTGVASTSPGKVTVGLSGGFLHLSRVVFSGE